MSPAGTVDHQMQLLHQGVCTSLNVGLYVCSSDSQVLYTVVVVVSESMIDSAKDAARDVIHPILAWVHQPELDSPDSFPGRKTVISQYSLWKAVNTEVSLHGPIRPTRLFKHSSQTVYSMIKDGVDSGSQMKSLISSTGVKVGWEP